MATLDWLDIFEQQGFKRVSVDGMEAVELPIYEAVYLSQIVGRDTLGNDVYIETEEGEYLHFPNPVPSVLVGDVETRFTLKTATDELSYRLNPLLSPSLDHMGERFPSFFENDVKYLTRKRIDITEYGLSDIYEDRVCITVDTEEENTGEPIITYLASVYLRKQGFIVGKFNESLAGRGAPDLFAVKLPGLQQELAEAGITAGGFYVSELELPAVRKQHTQVPEESTTALYEIESGKRFYDGKDEAAEYAESGWFNEAYGVTPFVVDRMENWAERGDLDVGYISMDQQGDHYEYPCPMDYGETDKVEYVKRRVRRVVKLALLKNVELSTALDVVGGNSFYDTIENVDQIAVEEIVNLVS